MLDDLAEQAKTLLLDLRVLVEAELARKINRCILEAVVGEVGEYLMSRLLDELLCLKRLQHHTRNNPFNDIIM